MADEEEVTSQNHSSNYSSESIYQENPREAFERMVKSFNDIEDSHFKLKEENAKLLAERQDLEDLRSKNVEMLEYISQLEKQVHLLKEECKAKDDREQNLRVDSDEELCLMADEEEVTSQNHSSNYSSESIYQENPREAFERMMKSFNDIEDSHFKLKEENAKLLAERQDLEDLRSKNVEMLEYISQLEKQINGSNGR
nr:lisH domain-containing protein C1711.05-like [Ipomoea batatas]